MRHPYFVPIMGGLCAALAGGIAQAYLPPAMTAGVPLVTPLAVALAAGLLGAGFWHWIISEPAHPSWPRGAIVGALTGVLAHPLAFWLTAMGQLLTVGTSREGLFNDLFVAPMLALLLSFISWTMIGWGTAVAGTLLGVVLAIIQEKVVPPPSWTGETPRLQS
jgi:hypothetical protein